MSHNVISQETKSLAMELYASGLNTREIESRLGIGHSTIQRLRIATGTKARTSRPNMRKHALDEAAFRHLTPAACYWLGFIAADGYVGQGIGRRIVSLCLQEKDAAHLDKFRAFVSTDKPKEYIQRVGTQFAGNFSAYRFSVASTVFIDRLQELNLGGKKPTRIPAAPLSRSRDFWRGVFDADGTIGCYYRQKSDAKQRWTMTISGPLLMIQGLADFINESMGMDKRPIPRKNIFNIRLYGNDAKKLCNLLYLGASTFLDRKMALAEQLMETVK